jgi:hypothetical protein
MSIGLALVLSVLIVCVYSVIDTLMQRSFEKKSWRREFERELRNEIIRGLASDKILWEQLLKQERFYKEGRI